MLSCSGDVCSFEQQHFRSAAGALSLCCCSCCCHRRHLGVPEKSKQSVLFLWFIHFVRYCRVMWSPAFLQGGGVMQKSTEAFELSVGVQEREFWLDLVPLAIIPSSLHLLKSRYPHPLVHLVTCAISELITSHYMRGGIGTLWLSRGFWVPKAIRPNGQGWWDLQTNYTFRGTQIIPMLFLIKGVERHCWV